MCIAKRKFKKNVMVNNSPISTKQTVCEWLFFNATSAIFQLYHGKNTLCTRPYAELDFHSVRTTVRMYTFLSTRTHYPDFEPTSLWSYSLMQRA